jgi:signal transduction histidine kinase
MPDPDAIQGPESLPTLRSELRERSKELGYLHQATRLIHARGEPRDTLRAVLELLPSAMCYPELAGARLCLGPLEIRTQGYQQSELSLRAEFAVAGEGNGFVELCYASAPPTAPVFLEEEQSLLGSLAELFRGHFDRSRDHLMSSVVSRELRSSLAVTVGWLQVLKQATPDPKLSARAMQILERNVALQTKLVDDLLDPSWISSGKLTLDSVRLDLAELVGFAVDAKRPAAQAKQLDLEAQLEPVGYVFGDPQRLQQVVYAVLGNALQGTPSGGRIHVALSADGYKARLVVKDSGGGIVAELLPSVLERFLAAVALSSRAGGLGLPLARQLIELHGGTISVFSHQPEPGTSIEIRLPLQAKTAPAG